jgi:TolA-binding protein
MLNITGAIHKQSQSLLTNLFQQYNNSKLRNVQGKVEEVKDLMKSNVQAALNNMEQLEDMEVKSEQFEEQARQFSKGATDVKRMMRCKYIKVTIVLAIIICTVIGVISWYAYKETHK